MSKRVKEMMISEIQSRIGDARDFLVLNSAKMDAITTNKMRVALRKQNIRAMVVPNSLAKKALRDVGVSSLDSLLTGPTTIVWGGQDIVALSKEMTKWAKDIEALTIRGGTVEGKAINAADVESLSKSPSREELIGKIAGLILAPGGRLAGALLGPGGRLNGQIKSIADKEPADKEPAAEAAPTT